MSEPLLLSRVIEGFYVVPALVLFGETGVADRWVAGEKFSLPDYCREHRLNPEVMGHMANYLAYVGILQRGDGGVYTPTESGKTILSLWAAVMVQYAYTPMMANIIPLARNEKQYGFGKDVYRDMHFDSRGSGLSGQRGGRFQKIIDYLLREKLRCLLDFGCGDGTFLAIACERIPGLKAVGIDQSTVSLDEARKNFAARGLDGRGVFVEGDLMRPGEIVAWDALREVDVASVWFILHELTYHSVEPAAEFLLQYKKHFAGVKLAVAEIYRLPDADLHRYDDRGMPEITLFHDLSRQKLLPREEWLRLYERVGLRVVDSVPLLERPNAQPAMEALILEAP